MECIKCGKGPIEGDFCSKGCEKSTKKTIVLVPTGQTFMGMPVVDEVPVAKPVDPSEDPDNWESMYEEEGVPANSCDICMNKVEPVEGLQLKSMGEDAYNVGPCCLGSEREKEYRRKAWEAFIADECME